MLYGVPFWFYYTFEKGKRKIENPMANILKCGSTKPALYELCFLLRKRNGMTIADVTSRMRIKKSYISYAERGVRPIRRLMNFWLRFIKYEA